SIGKKLETIAGSGSSLWIAASDRTLTRLDARTARAIGAPIALAPPPFALQADASGVWVASGTDSTIARVDVP
ncbi:MAG TPA: hypothetical protein VGK92_09685, partial [Gaiellales bacterium]